MNKVIDISEHNGNINFKKVKNAGIEGVILRLGWIGNKNNHTLDKKFNEYYSQAKENNLNIGIYVYSYCLTIEAIKSSINWISSHLTNKKINYPVFIDLEDSSISKLSKQELTNHAKIFCELLKQKGYKTGIYASKYWFTSKMDINQLQKYYIWLAEWGVKKPSVNFAVYLWQYTSSGRISGINGRVDENYLVIVENVDNNVNNSKKGGFEMKEYQNGSTRETVYQDKDCLKPIGSLNPYEKCECYGIIDNRPLVVYKIDGTNNKKVGFVKWLGGVKG